MDWDVKGYGPESAEEDLVREYLDHVFPGFEVVDLVERDEGWWGARVRAGAGAQPEWKTVKTEPVEDGEYLAIVVEGHEPCWRRKK